MSELYDQVQSQDERIQSLEDSKITNDINYDTMSNLTDFMRGNFWDYGTATLFLGTVTVLVPGLTLSSVVVISTQSANNVSYDKTVLGQLTIISTSAVDGHTVDYFVILNP